MLTFLLKSFIEGIQTWSDLYLFGDIEILRLLFHAVGGLWVKLAKCYSCCLIPIEGMSFIVTVYSFNLTSAKFGEYYILPKSIHGQQKYLRIQYIFFKQQKAYSEIITWSLSHLTFLQVKMSGSLAKYPKMGDVVSIYLAKHGIQIPSDRPLKWFSQGGVKSYNKLQVGWVDSACKASYSILKNHFTCKFKHKV